MAGSATRSPDAERSRRYRARQRRGRRVYPVDVPEFAVVEALLDRALISERDSRDPRLVGKALARVLTSWASDPERFRHP